MTVTYAERFQLLDTNFSATRDTLILGGSLSVILTFIVPFLSLTTPVPTIVWVGIAGLSYGSVALVIGRPTHAAYAGLLVTMTFAADIPLASNEYLRSMSRDLGPSLWLTQLPLVALLVLLFIRDSDTFLTLTQEEALLGGFVGWVVFAAIITTPMRFDTALFFALFVFWGLLVFAAVRRTHEILSIPPRTTIDILFFTIFMGSIYGLIEVANGESLGVTRLGELSPELSVLLSKITIGSLSIPVGTFVASFTGMSFILASLIVLIIPYALLLVLDSSRKITVIGGMSIIVMLFILRLSGSDAARGAAFLAIGLFLGMTTFSYLRDAIDIKQRQLAVLLVVALAGCGLLFVPSTQSGATSPSTDLTLSNSTPSTPTPSTPTQEGFHISNLSVPIFDLSNLGTRLQQYVVGTHLFLKNPLFGIGGANFEYVNQYGMTGNLPIHNIYLGLLVETGIVGAVLYIGFLFTVINRGLRSQTVKFALFSGIIGYLSFMFWDHMLFDSIVSSSVFYAICAVIVAENTSISAYAK